VSEIKELMRIAIETSHNRGDVATANTLVDCVNEMRRMEEDVVYILGHALAYSPDELYKNLANMPPPLKDKLRGMLESIARGDMEEILKNQYLK
jgi:hypothetical protein